jgi:hypothetical protein
VSAEADGMLSSLHWSERTSWDRQPSRLAELCAQAERRGMALTDLSESNPTRCGLLAPRELLARLGDAEGAHYRPDPRGLAAAREAVASYYRRRDLPADPAQIVLTTSTSEAYSWLFKLLADPGGELLVPRPSYPLLPMLAALECVTLNPYDLVRDEGWRVDVDALRRSVGPATRGIVLVHPNNPTGTLVRRDDAGEIARLAAERGLALVVDEVFGDYLHGPCRPDRLPSFAGTADAVCFVLGGLSKLALLPQLKLGWISCYGPTELVTEAVERLELIGDSFLSVSTAVQLSAPAILEAAPLLGAEARRRIVHNLGRLDQAIASLGPGCPLRRLPTDGGWYAMIEIPRTRSDDEWLERLVLDHGIVAHPGYLFGLPTRGTVVVGLLLEPARFDDAIDRALRCWAAG